MTLETPDNLSADDGNIIDGGALSTFYNWKAFDGDDQTVWLTVNGLAACYMGYKLASAKSLTFLKFINSYSGHTQYFAHSGVGERSDDGAAWTSFASFSGKTTPGELIALDASAAGSHQYWRTRGTDMDQAGCWMIAEFYLYSGGGAAPLVQSVCAFAIAGGGDGGY